MALFDHFYAGKLYLLSDDEDIRIAKLVEGYDVACIVFATIVAYRYLCDRFAFGYGMRPHLSVDAHIAIGVFGQGFCCRLCIAFCCNGFRSGRICDICSAVC